NLRLLSFFATILCACDRHLYTPSFSDTHVTLWSLLEGALNIPLTGLQAKFSPFGFHIPISQVCSLTVIRGLTHWLRTCVYLLGTQTLSYCHCDKIENHHENKYLDPSVK
ncbi:hypothetical protein STEG23_011593, partial [Scotinomys teguina]